MWSKEAGDNRNIYFLIITYINLKRMMLSYVSGNQHLQKTKKHSFTFSKKIDNMKLWSLLALNGRSLSSEEAEKKTASSSHKQAAVSLTPKLVWVLQWKKGTLMVYIKYEHVIILLLTLHSNVK